jgi:osmotically-inducible protein OsmY
MSPLPISDRALAQQVNLKLAQRGLRAPCRVDAQARRGDVTLSGTVQYAHQKTSAVQIASAMAGVRRVIDCLTVKAQVKH